MPEPSRAVRLALIALGAALSAAPATAQVIDHTSVRQYVGEDIIVSGPVIRAERMSAGTLRISLGFTPVNRTLDIIIPAEMASLFSDLRSYEGKLVQVRGRITAGFADNILQEEKEGSVAVPAILLEQSGRLQIIEARVATAGARPGAGRPQASGEEIAEPQPVGGDNRWILTVSPGLPLGGPSRQMEALLIAEGWNERYCDFKKTTCHENPLVRHPVFTFTGMMSRQFSRFIEAKGVFSFASLGSAEGRRGGVDVRADWSTAILGGTIALTPIPYFRVGAGPILGFLNSQRVDNEPRTVIRPGAIFEAGIRSSSRKALFVDLSATYRMLPRRSEGPWPGRRDAAVVPAGPGKLDANFSHFSLGLGLGWRFSSGYRD